MKHQLIPGLYEYDCSTVIKIFRNTNQLRYFLHFNEFTGIKYFNHLLFTTTLQGS